MLGFTVRRPLVLALVVAGGCSDVAGPAAAELGSQPQAVVYDEDDRHDVFEDRTEAAALATQSVVALIPAQSIERRGDTVSADPTPLRDLQGLCDDERFVGQPAAARCSGVLIDRDLVLTAGHCFADDAPCDTFAYAFNYHYSRRDQPTDITDLDVYGCTRIVAREHAVEGDELLDFAIVQLDRPVGANRRPAEVTQTIPAPGEPMTVIGCSQGLPLKIDSSAEVQSVAERAGYWTLNSDTFGGSSGSPAFDSALHVAGILVQGQDDYELDTARNCLKARRVTAAEGTATYERAADLRAAMQALCRADDSRQWACDVAAAAASVPVRGYASCSLQGPGSRRGSMSVICLVALALSRPSRRRERVKHSRRSF